VCECVCVYVCMCESAWNKSTVTGFSLNLTFDYFSKYVDTIQVSLKSDKNNEYFT